MNVTLPMTGARLEIIFPFMVPLNSPGSFAFSNRAKSFRAKCGEIGRVRKTYLSHATMLVSSFAAFFTFVFLDEFEFFNV